MNGEQRIEERINATLAQFACPETLPPNPLLSDAIEQRLRALERKPRPAMRRLGPLLAAALLLANLAAAYRHAQLSAGTAEAAARRELLELLIGGGPDGATAGPGVAAAPAPGNGH